MSKLPTPTLAQVTDRTARFLAAHALEDHRRPPAAVVRPAARDPNPLEVAVRAIGAWFGDNVGRIALNFQLKGGWEGWLQVELAVALLRAGLQVAREQQIFGSGARVDLLFGSGSTFVALELKTESAGNTKIFEGINDDLTKITEQPPKVPTGVLVIAPTASVTDAVQKLSMQTFGMQQVNSRVFDSGRGFALAIFWLG